MENGISAVVETAKNRVAAVTAAAAEAKRRREAAEGLLAEAEGLRSGLEELGRYARFLGPAEVEAKAKAEARLAEIEANGDYKSLKAEIEAGRKAEAARLTEADLARREAAKKAKKEAAVRSQTQKKVSEDIFGWVRETGPARLAVVVAWGGPGLARAAVRLEKDENGGGKPAIRISSVRGETRNFRAGQCWVAAQASLPWELRKPLQRAGWLGPAKAEKSAKAAEPAAPAPAEGDAVDRLLAAVGLPVA